MSIVDEITRLTSAKANIKAAIEAKGVSVPSSAHLDAFPSYVSAIQGGNDLYEAIATRDFSKFLSGSASVYIDDSTLSIIGSYAFTDAISARVITANFRNVTAISQYGFAYNSSAKGVVAKSLYLGFPELIDIGDYAFYSTMAIQSLSVPKVTTIGDHAFDHAYYLNNIAFPEALTIGNYAFANCLSMQTMSFPKVLSIGEYAFYGNQHSLNSVYFPAATYVASSAFLSLSSPAGQTGLFSASFPALISMGQSVFYGCQRLRSISFPALVTAGERAFANCRALTYLSFPMLQNASSGCFSGCVAVTEISFPELLAIGSSCFNGLSSVPSAYFPKVSTLMNYGMANWRAASRIRFDALTSVGTSALYQNFKLLSLYLLGDSVATLAQVGAFLSTPISTYTTSTGGVHGSIFVRASLLESYKTATNWATYSARFVGLTDEEIAALPV